MGARLMVIVAASLAGCAALGGGGGGGEELPNRGIVPYEEPPGPTEESPDASLFVLAPDNGLKHTYEEPSLVRTDSDQLVLYVEDRVASTGEGVILRAASDDQGASFGDPVITLAPEDGPAWLGTSVGGPSVVQDGDRWLMAFAYGPDVGIALASSDDGVSWSPDPTPALEGSMTAPCLVLDGARRVLFYAQDGAIRHAISEDGDPFEFAGTVLLPGTGCTSPSGNVADCWDAGSVRHPDVRLATTPTGRTVWRLFYTGARGSADANLGFAASYDGHTWDRYPYNPILDVGSPRRGPSNLFDGDRYLLAFIKQQTKKFQGVTLAVIETSNPTETF